MQDLLGQISASLRSVIDASPDPIFLKDCESRLLFANPATFTAIGRLPEHCIGRTSEEVHDDPAAGRMLRANDLSVLESGVAGTFEESINTPFGLRHYSVSKAPVHDLSGNVVGIVGTARDITDQRRMEDRLRRSEARYRQLYESLHDAFVQVAMDGRIEQCNDLFCALTGYSQDELKAMTYIDLTPARWHAMEAAILETQIRPRGYSEVYEKEYRRRDGTNVPVELRTNLVVGHDGRPDSMWAMVRDITERKAAEERLRRSEDRLRRALDIGLAGEWESVPATGEFHASDAALTLHGLAPGTSMTHEHALAAVHPDDKARVEQTIRHALETGEPYDIDLRCLRPDGSVVWLHARAEVHRDGPHQRLVGLVQDITERKLAEARERLLLDEVNHRSKNLIGLIVAIIRQTAAVSVDNLAPRIEDRLRALSANHRVLMKNGWHNVPLDALLRSQLGHFADLLGSRILLSGPMVAIKPNIAQAIGMAVHELATNAAKYGALSNDSGTVCIQWALHGEGDGLEFSLVWQEAGGPAVSAPVQRGFGSLVTGDMIRTTCNGDVTTAYDAHGLRWRLSCRAANVVGSAASGDRDRPLSPAEEGARPARSA